MDYSLNIENAYKTLYEINTILLERYINPHKGKVESTEEDFSLDVKSYLVLLHAAIEDYIEGISVFTSNAACEIFRHEERLTIPLLFLFAKSKSFKERVTEKN